VRIEVWVTDHQHQNKSYKNVHLRDDGVGFETSLYEKLLRPFERAEPDAAKKNESELHFMRGVGLGLAVCYRILENHRGFFTATSQVGVGSEFILRFPVLGSEVMTELRDSQAGRLY
jgi:signal transduction histidine kinase